ncbi:type II toxin-antitoxin system PemK/MazF family toxin [Proteiniclasticum sp. BAD-10]|uniref:Type II toxin-antitoxin system PemK/MazF family toxin n=1 Tax=Proteiniclasticum sediminis TaxID=2804028 RepID=A0A941HPY1_9CLOT|nr:type II toxin-antitoxin system PemK/MazF family toxin [Proteiniclasticum sediminis]MBR0575891.1 type II toxin-antitoxin system PemK/MazF family toxin [Proteiniclasticum sediminis]
MRFSDIKVGYIYNVVFDPVRGCEFDGKHLALTLKKNNDKKTFIVMPLTSSPSGAGVNKIELGSISSLPTSLKGNRTFAVINQIRTVNVDRFIALKEGNNAIECPIDINLFLDLSLLGIRELLHNVPQDSKIEIYKKAYEGERVIKAKDLAYTIKGLKSLGSENEEEIAKLKLDIKALLQNISFSLDKKHIADGIQSIFDEAMQQ